MFVLCSNVCIHRYIIILISVLSCVICIKSYVITVINRKSYVIIYYRVKKLRRIRKRRESKDVDVLHGSALIKVMHHLLDDAATRMTGQS